MTHHNQKKLADKLRELFNIKGERQGVAGVWTKDDTYSTVILELGDFIFADYEIKRLFEAKEYAKASGFYMVPRLERESDARHYIVFHF